MSIITESKMFPLPDPNKDRRAPVQDILEYNGEPVWIGVLTGWDNCRAGEGLLPEEDAIESYLSEYFPDYIVAHRNYFENHGRGHALLWKKPVIHRRLEETGLKICAGLKIFSVRGSKVSPYVELAIRDPKNGYRHVLFNYIEGVKVGYGWPPGYEPHENDKLIQFVRETLNP